MTIGQEVRQAIELSSPVVVLFSMNRAMQLDATLRSFYRHCQDAINFDLYILYKTTSTVHCRQYKELIQEFNQIGRINPIPEAHFRIDLLNILFRYAFRDWRSSFYKALSRFNGIIGRVTSRWIRPASSRQVLFLVDDNIFVKDFSLGEARESLISNPNALGFSLRLGKNTRSCYAHDRPQKLPQFKKAALDFLIFDWTKGEHDFHYPLEVSSSIYRLVDVLPLINSRSFTNPNKLEEKIAASSSLFIESHPWLLCYPQSVTFCNPVNRVQNQLLNRTGITHDYPLDLLADMYDGKYQIDVAAYDDFISNGCHQEVALQFIRRES